MGSRPERGAYGNARGKPAKQRQRRDARMANPRVVQALLEARQHQAKIDAAIEAGHVGPGRPQLVYSGVPADVEKIKEQLETRSFVAIPEGHDLEITFHIDWNIKDVYQQLAQGYLPKQVAKRTKYDHDVILELWADILEAEEQDDPARQTDDDSEEEAAS